MFHLVIPLGVMFGRQPNWQIGDLFIFIVQKQDIFLAGLTHN